MGTGSFSIFLQSVSASGCVIIILYHIINRYIYNCLQNFGVEISKKKSYSNFYKKYNRVVWLNDAINGCGCLTGRQNK